MDYSKLSDFEINGLVASLTQRIGDHTQANGKTFIHEHADVGELKQVCIGWKEFDPVNNPADAWPIIASSRITMNAQGKTAWFCFSSTAETMSQLSDGNHHFSHSNENPLRAAMIVFLMMKENG